MGDDPGRSVSRHVDQIRDRATAVLGRLNLLAIDEQIARRDESIEPFSLRSFDAIHPATALYLDDLETLVTYDQRLAQAAAVNGLHVASPGATPPLTPSHNL